MNEALMTTNEARLTPYRVAFLDTKDADGVPYTVQILVEKDNQKDFENFLNSEQDNIFAHAEGGNVEY